MCGRFAFYSPTEATAALFGVRTSTDMSPRYNISPSQEVVAIRHSTTGELELASLRWGLVSFWAKDASIGNHMINARAETVATKPSFRNAYRKRRCLILVDGFYEWQRNGDVKTPWYISPLDQAPCAFAGLWEDWTEKETGESLQTAAIVTTAADAFMSRLHSRMPVLLISEPAQRWMDGDPDLLLEAAAVYPKMQAWPVDRKVNNARNQGADLVEPAGEAIFAQ